MTNTPQVPLQQPSGLSFQSMIKPVEGTEMPKSMAIMGVYKVGKTSLAASAARIKRFQASGREVLILEAESGTASIAEDYPEVQMFSLTTHAGFQRAIDELLTQEHNYGILVIDTFDKFVEYAVHYFIDGAPDTRKAWGYLKDWIVDTTWRLHKSNIFTIFLFHEESERDEVTGQRFTTFKLPGGAKKDLGQIYDIISRLDIRMDDGGEPKRYLQLGPAVGQVTGSRYERKLPNAMVDPTMDQIFDLIAARRPVDTPVTTDNTTTNNK